MAPPDNSMTDGSEVSTPNARDQLLSDGGANDALSQRNRSGGGQLPATPKSARSAITASSGISGLSGYSSTSDTPSSSLGIDPQPSPSKQLISDLVWLERKIAGNSQSVIRSDGGVQDSSTEVTGPQPHAIQQSDSLSFLSGDNNNASVTRSKNSSASSASQKQGDGSTLTSKSGPKASRHSIVCRDCYAPPGKLKIVIHSTKDGPAVHTVKKGSTLEGHVFAGDLIISVDNVDTRSYTAEQVMKMMTAKTRYERKITVLHFEEEAIDDGPGNQAAE
jgi:hypothetical protein